MKKTFLCLFVSSMAALNALAATMDGTITLKQSDAFSKDAFTKTFGETVKATVNWRVDDFFGAETIFAGATVKNDGKNAVVYHYYVAFFDKNHKLIGCSGQGSFDEKGLGPGKDEQLGSCLIKLPKGKYKEVASYECVLYEESK